jgi:isopropylmalate/homocitrate/citramalate synthase
VEFDMISILDTTYREGKQSYLGNILPDSMVNYAKLLKKVGINYMEIGYPFTSDIYLHEFRKLLKEKINIQICVHSALDKDNFKKLIEEGVTVIATSVRFKNPTKDTISSKIFEIKQAIDYCSSISNNALLFRIGIENAFKLPEFFLLTFCKKILKIDNIIRISLSDTDGSTTPKVVKSRLAMLDKLLPKNKVLELHLHNDCNLASANLYEAFILFKNSKREFVIDATLGGIGERNGVTSIGDIFSLLYHNDKNLLRSNYFTKYYADLYKYIFKEQVFNRDPLNPTSFSHSSGLHIAKFLETGSYQSINPETFGYKPKLIFNDFINSDAICVLLKMRLGIDINKKRASEYASIIRNLSAEKKSDFSEAQILKILEGFLKI